MRCFYSVAAFVFAVTLIGCNGGEQLALDALSDDYSNVELTPTDERGVFEWTGTNREGQSCEGTVFVQGSSASYRYEVNSRCDAPSLAGRGTDSSRDEPPIGRDWNPPELRGPYVSGTARYPVPHGAELRAGHTDSVDFAMVVDDDVTGELQFQLQFEGNSAVGVQFVVDALLDVSFVAGEIGVLSWDPPAAGAHPGEYTLVLRHPAFGELSQSFRIDGPVGFATAGPFLSDPDLNWLERPAHILESDDELFFFIVTAGTYEPVNMRLAIRDAATGETVMNGELADHDMTWIPLRIDQPGGMAVGSYELVVEHLSGHTETFAFDVLPPGSMYGASGISVVSANGHAMDRLPATIAAIDVEMELHGVPLGYPVRYDLQYRHGSTGPWGIDMQTPAPYPGPATEPFQITAGPHGFFPGCYRDTVWANDELIAESDPFCVLGDRPEPGLHGPLPSDYRFSDLDGGQAPIAGSTDPLHYVIVTSELFASVAVELIDTGSGETLLTFTTELTSGFDAGSIDPPPSGWGAGGFELRISGSDGTSGSIRFTVE